MDKFRKAELFARVNGKCEYCGKSMVLFFDNKLSKINTLDCEATVDHKYSRDHENRQDPNPLFERRLFLVCRKCNSGKAKLEPQLNEPKSIEKTTRKLLPKDLWDDETFKEKIKAVVDREKSLCKEIGTIDKQVKCLSDEKQRLLVKISKAARYRNLLISIRKESKQNVG